MNGNGIVGPISKSRAVIAVAIVLGFMYIVSDSGAASLPWFLLAFIVLTLLVTTLRIRKFTIEAYQMTYHEAERELFAWLEDEGLSYKKTIRSDDGLTVFEVDDDVSFHAVVEERHLFGSKTDKRTIIDIERDGFTHKLAPRAEELIERLHQVNSATAPVKRAMFHLIPGAVLLLPGVTAFILG
ncbi:hypothetical protein BCL52_0770 [Salisediminibacterium halotolerans]|nr:hypothetical protein BCL39_0772 [Actinophytocola xinjiangensis]RPE88361.1 hypothetical protein EDD67_0687 [Salisediminibacterium halotolerans]TWG37276.1 hypothetical protein BCL52_0770 [Salisediminibacterium halotolerans]